MRDGMDPPSSSIAGEPVRPADVNALPRAAHERQSPWRLLLMLAGVLFASASILYTSLWMYYERLVPRVELGIQMDSPSPAVPLEIIGFLPGSPAQKAGLQVHDQVLAVNGRSLTVSNFNELLSVERHGKPGDTITLTVRRPGRPELIEIHTAFRALSDTTPAFTAIAIQILGSYPLVFLVVSLAVLFMRIEDRNAWLLALLFCAFIAVSNIPDSLLEARLGQLKFMLAYRSIMVGIIAPLFYFLFAVFPERSPLERRMSWLKWFVMVLGASIAIPGIFRGDPRPIPLIVAWLGEKGSRFLVLGFIYTTLVLGLISLVLNAMTAQTSDAKRKIRVLLWGTMAGVAPVLVIKSFSDFAGFHVPVWLDCLDVVLLTVFPLSFAYAVVKHRVLEIPVLLRRSARYVLVRRGFAFFIILLALSLNALFAISLSRFFRMQPQIATSAGMSFGILLAWVSAPALRRSTERIDRAFFRGAYDARIVLQDLAHRVRAANSKEELAGILEQHLNLALHPSSLDIYLKGANNSLQAMSKNRPGPRELPLRSETQAIFLEENPVEITPYRPAAAWLPGLELLNAECLAPVLGRSGEPLGLVVLGQRLSEEPYSSEDKLLLGSVTNQAGIALENIRLAENMANRMERDRRAEQEMQIAREVQKKLLPQEMPSLRTLDYSGACIQARSVGGDYYDFLDLGSGRVGFVLADIAGKGISGALLMANLQANLRGQYALAGENLPALLRAVNRLFYKNTESSHYATLFFALYHDNTRKLVYANCGHNPPLLLRASGKVEQLASTATVLGLFETWDCEVAEVQLAPGDVLAIYTDGVTEAANPEEEEFGEQRLAEFLQTNRNLAACDLLPKVLATVQHFSPGEQADDLTLIVARAR